MPDNGTLTTEEIERKMVYDFEYYAPRALKVQTMEGVLSPFELNEPQRMLEEIIRDIKADGRLVRLMILKARREGVSTWTEGRFYWKASTRYNRYAVCVTHEPEATSFLFKMTKRFHDQNLPDWKPQTKYSNQRLLEFNTPDGKGGLDSAFRVGTAGKEDFGSGQLIHYLHLSEVAKWPKSTETSLLTSLLQCVPDEPDTEVVMESTAKGIGGEFYGRFFSARYQYDVVLRDGVVTLRKRINEKANIDSAYSSAFLPWFVFPKYQMDVPAGFVRYVKPKDSQDDRECEETLAKLYGLTDRQLAWRRHAIANRCGGDENVFKQEYPSNPIECFLSSGRPVFNNAKLMAYKEACKPPTVRYDCLLSSGQWLAKADGRLKVWQEPIAGRAYIIGADVAEGLAHGDYSSADVIDHLTGKQVATWHGHCDPDDFGRILFWIARRYNNAWVGPERNNHGLMTVTTLSKDLKYQRIYAEMVPEPPGKPRKRLGWQTSSTTRPLIIDNLIVNMRETPHNISDPDHLDEMMCFKTQDNGKAEADEGMCDDRVMSLAIACYLRKTLPLPSMAVQNYAAQTARTGVVHGQRRQSIKGWT